MDTILERSRPRWPFQHHSAAWLPTLTLCLLGCLLTARGQDPKLTNTNYPMDTNVSLGATVSFRVYASSTNNPMTYQWQHAGTNLPSATNVILSIPNVTVAHSGGYMATVTNASGESTNSRTATLTVDPTFTKIMTGGIVTDAEGSLAGNWADYDNDGYVDLFVANSALSGTTLNTLYHNKGGTNFSRVTASPFTTDSMRAWSAAWADYDNDGHQELRIIHDSTSFTWRCQADGPFVPTTQTNILNSVGLRVWGDYDNDGWLDAFSEASDYHPTLFRNLGAAGGFTNVTAALNMTTPVAVGIPTWDDYDNDGWLDVFFPSAYWLPTNTPNGLFHNNRDGTFTQILSGSPVYDGGRPYAPSWIDYDNDGFLDLFIAAGDAVPERNLLYRNNGNTNHWLKVKLDGRASNRSGIGARVRAYATINGQTFWQMREISCENAYAGQNGLLAHFGLGDATNVTTLRIEWPSGIVQELTNVAPNQFLKVVECQSYAGRCPSFTGATRDSSGLRISITEPAATARYILEGSTNLVNWTKLMAQTSAGGTAQYTDTRATNYTRRFYRLVVP